MSSHSLEANVHSLWKRHELSVNDQRLPEAPAARSAAELRELKRKITLLVKAFAPQPDMKVLPNPDKGWACGIEEKNLRHIEDFIEGRRDTLTDNPDDKIQPSVIYYDTEEIAAWSEGKVFGVMRHEIGHARHTDYKCWFEAQRFAKKDGYSPLSIAYLYNALEDPWINNREIADSQAVRTQMEELYGTMIPEVRAEISKATLLSQLGMNVIHYWATSESMPEITDQRVLSTFETIKPQVNKFFEGKTSRENFQNLVEEIWPQVKPLIDQANQDSAKNNMAKQAGQDGQKSSGKGGQSDGTQGGQAGSSNQSAEDPSKKNESIFDRLKKKMFGDDQNKDDQKKDDKQPEESNLDPKDRKKLEDELKDSGNLDDIRKIGEKIKKNEELSEEEKQKLSDAFDALSDEQKESLLKKATEANEDELAQDLNKKLPKGSSFEKQKDGTYRQKIAAKKEQDQNDAEETIEKILSDLDTKIKDADKEEEALREEQRRKEAEALQKELRTKQMIREGFDPDEQSDLFDKFKDLESEVLPLVQSFVQSINEYLPKTEAVNYEGSHYTGTRINHDVLSQRIPVQDFRIYRRRQTIKSDNPNMFVELLIDNTASMGPGEYQKGVSTKITESVKTAIFWSMVLEQLEIPFAIRLFGSGTIEVKSFEESYGAARSPVKARLVKLADASMYSTDIGSPLIESDQAMTVRARKTPGSLGGIFFISDSGANTGLLGQSLKTQIQTTQRRFIVQNFILSTSSSEVAGAKELFGESNVVAPSDFSKLPQESARILRITLDKMMRNRRT